MNIEGIYADMGYEEKEGPSGNRIESRKWRRLSIAQKSMGLAHFKIEPLL
jgi:hypothetical protein